MISRRLPAFSKHFDTLKGIHADLHPPLAAAVVKLSTLVQDIEQDMDFGELSLSQQHAFFQSKLYTQCSLRKVSARLLKSESERAARSTLLRTFSCGERFVAA